MEKGHPSDAAVTVRAEPATVTAAPADDATVEHAHLLSEHVLALYQGTAGRNQGLFFGQCSCAGWSAAYHEDRERLESLHATHVARKSSVAAATEEEQIHG